MKKTYQQEQYNELHPRPKSRYEQFQEWLNECPVEIANYLDYTDTFEVTFRVPLEDSAEGINVKGLEAAVFLRNMDIIGLSQTIGRVIRTGDNDKKYGLVVVPTWDKVGISTSKRLSGVVDTVFNRG